MHNCKCHKSCHCNKTDMLENACNDVSNCPCNYSNNECNACECGFDEESVFPENPLLAQSYVPFQVMNETFTPDVGLKMGTIFPELVSPYCPNQSVEFINFVERTNEIKEGCNNA